MKPETLFLPDILEDWALVSEGAETTVNLNVKINGTTVRKQPVAAATQESGQLFAQTLIPEEYWHGQEILLELSREEDGEVVFEKRVLIPDSILNATERLFGQCSLDAAACSVFGWAKRADIGAAEVIAVMVDGEEVARTVADAPSDVRVGLKCGFHLMLPIDVRDGEDHEIDVVLDPEHAKHVLFSARCGLPKAEMTQLTARVELLRNGELSGVVDTTSFTNTEPVHLVLLIGESEYGSALVKDDGQFSFDLSGFDFASNLGSGIAIVEPFSGLPLAGVSDDLFLKSVVVELLRQDDDIVDLRFLSALPLTGDIPATLEVGQTSQALTFSAAKNQAYHVSNARLAVSEESTARLRLGQTDLYLPFVTDRDPNSYIPRSGLDAYVPSSDPVVLNAVAHSLSTDTAPVVSLLVPNYAGQWTVSADGILQGWVLDLARPFRHFDVQVKSGDKVAAETQSDQMVPLFGTGMPNVWPFGFRVPLDELEIEGGSGELSVHLPEAGTDLPFVPFVDSDHAPTGIECLVGAIGGLPELSMDHPLRTAMLMPVTHEAATCLDIVFTALDRGQPGKQAERLGPALRNRIRELFTNEEHWRGLICPQEPLPHHRLQTPLLGVDIAPLLALVPEDLPLHQTLVSASNWRDLLKSLLDPDLFRHLLNPNDPRDWICLQICNAIRDGDTLQGYPHERIEWAPGGKRNVQVSADLEQSDRLVVCNALGLITFDEQITKTRTVFHALAKLARIFERQPSEDRLFLAAQTEGTWRVAVLDMKIRDEVETIEVDPDIEIDELEIGQSYARVRCDSRTMPDRFHLRIGPSTFVLSPLSELFADLNEDNPSGGQTYLTCLSKHSDGNQLVLAPAVPDGTDNLDFDLRLETPDGLRPRGLPAEVALSPGHYIDLSGIRFEKNAICGTMLSTDENNIRLVLCEHVTLTAEELDAAGEDAEPVETVALASVQTRPIKGRIEKNFSIPLPARLLDGVQHSISIDVGEATLWQGQLTADTNFVKDQMATINNHGIRVDSLVRFAKAQRADLLEELLLSVRSSLSEALRPEDSFEILLNLKLALRPEPLSPALESLLESLWVFALHSEERMANYLKIAARLVTESRQDVPLRRFPQAPLGELLTDMVFLGNTNGVEEALRLTRLALSARRFPLVKEMCRKMLAAHDKDHRVHELVGAIELQHGRSDKAETHAQTALALKHKSGPARLLLARALVHQGRTLEGLAAATGGRGLSDWLGKSPNYEHVKLAAPLDWAGAYAAVGEAEDREAMIRQTRLADAATGPRATLADTPYSVFFLKQPEQDLDELFMELRRRGQCTQVAVPEVGSVAEMEATGRWAFIFSHPRPVTADLLATIFQQKRPAEGIVTIMSCGIDKQGSPMAPVVTGAVIRSDLLRCFGPVPLAEFIERARGKLRMKTILI
jgi:hypothetical protein